MLLEELDLPVPDRLIAQHPAEPRDSCRLMHLEAGGACSQTLFSDLPRHLRAGDMLVFNDSRVLPARVQAFKPTGGAVEVLFVRPVGPTDGPSVDRVSVRAGGRGPTDTTLGESWEVLARPSHRLRPGSHLVFPGGETVELVESLGEGRWVVSNPPDSPPVAIMERHGRLPLPPYIKTYPDDPSSYQTVYAAVPGSAAAPTAGLHFTPELLGQLSDVGIGAAYVTLHVGLDTFLPIREAVVEDHRIHRESYFVAAEQLGVIRAARAAGSRLVAVGTTATRVLETLARTGALDASAGTQSAGGSTDIFITPGYRFLAVGALVTNLHLPRSSVLALTMAFAGVERLRSAYRQAIDAEYRFFSFGDAMLIDRPSDDAGGVMDEHS